MPSSTLNSTPSNGVRAPLALGMLRESTGQTYSFGHWTLAAWPLVAALLVAGRQVIIRFFPIDIASVRDAEQVIEDKALRMGRPSANERAIGVIMLGSPSPSAARSIPASCARAVAHPGGSDGRS